MRRYLYPIIILVLLLSSCNLDEKSETISDETPITDNQIPPITVDQTTPITINQSLLPSGDAKQTYLLLTNPTNTDLSVPKVSINGLTSRSLPEELITNEHIATSMKRVDAPVKKLNLANASAATTRTIQETRTYELNDTEIFNVLTNSIPEVAYEDIPFTLKSISLDIGGTLIDLYIWVDSKELNNYPVDSIPFLQTKFKEIYPDMLNLYGSHWGEHIYSNLINSEREDIHILLMDIAYDENDNGDAGSIYGYFSSYDLLLNSENVTDSNQCLNVVLDSHVYFNRDSLREWSPNNIETIYGVSTLIHEFQHMINNYLKVVVNQIGRYPTNEEIFVDEMLAMAAEDLLAYKHLTYQNAGESDFIFPAPDRVPGFNQGWMDYSTFFWDNNLQSYSNAYTLGAYLIRNYNDFISNYLKSSLMGIDGIVNAISQEESDSTYSKIDLLHNFGLAVLNSSKENEEKPIKFNNIDFMEYKGYTLETLNLISSDQFNPEFTPYTLNQNNSLSSSEVKSFKSESNIYIDLGEISSLDVIEIDFYNSGDDIEYSFVF